MAPVSLEDSPAGSPGIIAQALHALVSQIPTSNEKVGQMPALRVHGLAKGASIKAAAISGGFTLPSGPFGMATVLPDLLAVWRIQQQLVADIAAAYGRSDALSPETMILCLFKHGGAAMTQRLLSRRADDNIVVHRIASRALHQMLEKIGVRLGQRLAAKSVSRWVPLLGAIGAGAYAYYDTMQVAKNAQQLFSNPLHLEPAAESTPPSTLQLPTFSSDAAPTSEPPSKKSRRKRSPGSKKSTKRSSTGKSAKKSPKPTARSKRTANLVPPDAADPRPTHSTNQDTTSIPADPHTPSQTGSHTL
jgi:hypothetical protein